MCLHGNCQLVCIAHAQGAPLGLSNLQSILCKLSTDENTRRTKAHRVGSHVLNAYSAVDNRCNTVRLRERSSVCADGFACVRTCVCEFLLCVFLYASEQIRTHWITYMQ